MIAPPAGCGPREACPLRHPTLRTQLRRINASWVFGALWLWLVTGATMTRFARELGTPDWAFGILAAIPALATLVQLPTSTLLNGGWCPKRLFILSQIASRALWLVVAFIPWLWPGLLQNAWQAMLFILVVVWALHHVGIPAWMNWMAAVVPRPVRGHFYGIRQRVSRPIAIVATVAVGWLLDVVQSGGGALMLRTTSILLAVAGLFGILEVLMYRRVDVPAVEEHVHDTGWWQQLAQPLQDKNFRWFILFSIALGLATGFLAHYVWLYMFDVGGYTNLQANVLLIAVPGAINLVVFPFWGRMVDRKGRKPVIVIALSGMLISPIGWVLLCTRSNELLGLAMVMAAFVTGPGLELATMNYMFDLAGTRDEKTGGSAYVAVNNMAMAGAVMVSGLLGAGCAHWLGDLDWTVPHLGVPITYHGVLFLYSTVLRGIALVFALQFQDVGSAPAREVIRYMTSSLYGNVRQVLLMPIRVVGHLAPRTYRLRDERRQDG